MKEDEKIDPDLLHSLKLMYAKSFELVGYPRSLKSHVNNVISNPIAPANLVNSIISVHILKHVQPRHIMDAIPEEAARLVEGNAIHLDVV